MKRYKTPAGNEYSEEELRSKYGEQFDSLVADGTLELVGEAIDTEKKKPCRYSFRWGRGSYGIHYRNGNTSWVFGWFRSKR